MNDLGGTRLRVVRPDTRKMLIDPARGNVRWELLSPDLQRQMEVVQMTLEPALRLVRRNGWCMPARNAASC